jgi:hypothetical protein
VRAPLGQGGGTGFCDAPAMETDLDGQNSKQKSKKRLAF